MASNEEVTVFTDALEEAPDLAQEEALRTFEETRSGVEDMEVCPDDVAGLVEDESRDQVLRHDGVATVRN